MPFILRFLNQATIGILFSLLLLVFRSAPVSAGVYEDTATYGSYQDFGFCSGTAAQGVFARLKGTNQLIAGVTIKSEKVGNPQVKCTSASGFATSTGSCVTGSDGGCTIEPINCGSITGSQFHYSGTKQGYSCLGDNPEANKVTVNNSDNSVAIVDCDPDYTIQFPLCTVQIKDPTTGAVKTSAGLGETVRIEAKIRDRDTGADVTPMTIKVRGDIEGGQTWFAEESPQNPATLTKTVTSAGTYTVSLTSPQKPIGTINYQAASCTATLEVTGTQTKCVRDGVEYTAGQTVTETGTGNQCTRTRTCQADGTWQNTSWTPTSSCPAATCADGSVASQTTSCDAAGGQVCTSGCPANPPPITTPICTITPASVADKSRCGATCQGLGDSCYCVQFNTTYGGFSTAPTGRNWDFGANVSGGTTDANSPNDASGTYRGYQTDPTTQNRTITSTYTGGNPSSLSCSTNVSIPPTGSQPPPSTPPSSLTCLQPGGSGQGYWHADCVCSGDSCNSCRSSVGATGITGTKKPRNIFDQSMNLGNTCYQDAVVTGGPQTLHVAFTMNPSGTTPPASPNPTRGTAQTVGQYAIGAWGCDDTDPSVDIVWGYNEGGGWNSNDPSRHPGTCLGIVGGFLSNIAPGGGFLGAADISVERHHAYDLRVTPANGKYRKMTQAAASTQWPGCVDEGPGICTTNTINSYPNYQWPLSATPNPATNGGGWTLSKVFDPSSWQDPRTSTLWYQRHLQFNGNGNTLFLDTWWKYLEPSCGAWTTTFNQSVLTDGQLAFDTDSLDIQNLKAFQRSSGSNWTEIPSSQFSFVVETIDVDGKPKTGKLRVQNIDFPLSSSPNTWDVKFTGDYFDGVAQQTYETFPNCQLSNVKAWFQGKDGSIHAGGIITNAVPVGQKVLTDLVPASSGAGVLACTTLQSVTQQAAATRAITNYAPAPWPVMNVPQLEARGTTVASFTDLPSPLQHGGVYILNGNQTLGAKTFSVSGATGSIPNLSLIRVKGDLAITGDVTLINPLRTGVIFLVSGKITVGTGVTTLRGLLISESLSPGAISTAPSGFGGQALTADGMWYSRGSMQLYRFRDPTQGATEEVRYQPQYLFAPMVFPELAKPSVQWKEIEPKAP
ncbi:MAG: hypothetical protein Q8R11_02225 [bacterium]|nr:hypothetical protein [bacterium]